MPYFEVKTPRRAARLRLEGSFVVVGRAEPIPLFHDDPSLSREHAALAVVNGVVRVRDLGSKNRVFLNGAALERYAEVPLRPGDVLRMGATTLTLREGDGKVVEKAPAKKTAEKDGAAKDGKTVRDPDVSEDTSPTIIEGIPVDAVALVNKDGEPISQGLAAQELDVPPDGTSSSEDALDGVPTPDPDAVDDEPVPLPPLADDAPTPDPDARPEEPKPEEPAGKAPPIVEA